MHAVACFLPQNTADLIIIMNLESKDQHCIEITCQHWLISVSVGYHHNWPLVQVLVKKI